MKRVTIKMVAEAVGMSPASVSLVLNNKPCRIPEETREKIIQKAREMNYYPNAAAVSLKTSRSRSLGFIVPDIHNEYYSLFAQGMEDACYDRGWHLILCTTSSNMERESQYIDMFYTMAVDGICLCNAQALSEQGLQKLLGLELPIVQTDRTNYQSSFSLVTTDHRHGGFIATKHLLSLGHRKILFVTGPSSLEGSSTRLEGCKDAFRSYGLAWDDSLVFEGDYMYRSGQRAIDSCISKDFSAVFAFNDLMACGVYNALAKYSLSIPDDISVIGYDDQFVSRVMNVPLTTVHQPVYDMGRKSADILIDQAEGKQSEPVISMFELELIVRNSTCPFKEKNHGGSL